jgi:hypothetical protein
VKNNSSREAFLLYAVEVMKALKKRYYDTCIERNLMEIKIMKQKPADDRRKMRCTLISLLFIAITALANVRGCQLTERALQVTLQKAHKIEYPVKFPEYHQLYQNSSAKK